jgi:hypothetical protein
LHQYLLLLKSKQLVIDFRSLGGMGSEMGVWSLVRQAARTSGIDLATSAGCTAQRRQGPAGRPGLDGGVGGLSPGGSSSDDEGDDSSIGFVNCFGLVNCFQVFQDGSQAEANGEAVAADGGASGGTDSDSKAKGGVGDSCCNGPSAKSVHLFLHGVVGSVSTGDTGTAIVQDKTKKYELRAGERMRRIKQTK